jgi:hypothetical protein
MEERREGKAATRRRRSRSLNACPFCNYYYFFDGAQKKPSNPNLAFDLSLRARRERKKQAAS